MHSSSSISVRNAGFPRSAPRLRSGPIRWTILAALGLLVAGGPAFRGHLASATASSRVTLLRVPNGGIQPQAVVDGKGVLHLVYFKGDPGAGDLYYVREAPGQAGFSRPIRVNSQSGSAIAAGTIRGAQIALGANGRIQIAWNGSGTAAPKPPGGGVPMLYSRSNADGTAFEPQRNLMRFTRSLDGGGSIGADSRGNVYVVWHGADRSTHDEASRHVWIAVSRNNGRTFAPEALASDAPTGACGCCGTRTFVDRRGAVYILYRAAGANVHRDMTLLVSRDHGAHFRGADLQAWEINACPMSSESFAESLSAVVGAWETRGQVSFAKIDPATLRASRPVAAPGVSADRKHPSLATGPDGAVLMAWTEGTGWQKGGNLAWQLFDRDGRPLAEKGRVANGIPTWGLPATCARSGGHYILIY